MAHAKIQFTKLHFKSNNLTVRNKLFKNKTPTSIDKIIKKTKHQFCNNVSFSIILF